MSEHRLVIWEPSFRKYVKDYEGEGNGSFGENNAWSTSYLKREGVIPGSNAPDADNHYECICGESFGTDEKAAKKHVRKKRGGENQ